jgi:hypothetical protein
MSESINASREQFARQTRRPLFSLEAIQPGRRVLARLPVGQSSPLEKKQFATVGPSGESPKAQEHFGLGPSRGLSA